MVFIITSSGWEEFSKLQPVGESYNVQTLHQELFPFTKAWNPDFEPSMAGAPSVHTPHTPAQLNLSSSKKHDTFYQDIFTFSCLFQFMAEKKLFFQILTLNVANKNHELRAGRNVSRLMKLDAENSRVIYLLYSLIFNVVRHITYPMLHCVVRHIGRSSSHLASVSPLSSHMAASILHRWYAASFSVQSQGIRDRMLPSTAAACCCWNDPLESKQWRFNLSCCLAK